MKRLFCLVLCAALSLAVCSCASAPKDAQRVKNIEDLRSVQSYYADQLEKLHPGMTVAEFRQLFPEAYPTGQSGEFTEYEIARDTKYVSDGDVLRQNLIWGVGHPTAKHIKQSIWFYFQKERFVSWGTTKGWPNGPQVSSK